MTIDPTPRAIQGAKMEWISGRISGGGFQVELLGGFLDGFRDEFEDEYRDEYRGGFRSGFLMKI